MRTPNRGWTADDLVRTLGYGVGVVVTAVQTGLALAVRDDADLTTEGVLLASGVERAADLRVLGSRRGLAGTVDRLPLALLDTGVSATAVRRMLVDAPAGRLTIRGTGEER